jgi:hypothetical protein
MGRGQIGEIVFTDDGDLATGASVAIYDARTTDPASHYAAESGGVASTAPVSTVQGRIERWTTFGEYDLVVSGAGITTYTRRVVLLDGGETLLLASSIPTALLDNDAVTTAKLADGAVTTAKLAANSVTGAKIVNDTISTSKLATKGDLQWRIVGRATAIVPAAQAANTYVIGVGGTLTASVTSPANINTAAAAPVALDSFDQLVITSDLTNYFRVRMLASVNGVAPGATFTGRMQLAAITGSNVLVYTTTAPGPFATGAVITTPGLGAQTYAYSAAVAYADLDPDSPYYPTLTISAATAANSWTVINWWLEQLVA